MKNREGLRGLSEVSLSEGGVIRSVDPCKKYYWTVVIAFPKPDETPKFTLGDR